MPFPLLVAILVGFVLDNTLLVAAKRENKNQAEELSDSFQEAWIAGNGSECAVDVNTWASCVGINFAMVPDESQVKELANSALTLLKKELENAEGLPGSFASLLAADSLEEGLAAFLAAKAAGTSSADSRSFTSLQDLIQNQLSKSALLFALCADAAKAASDPAVESLLQPIAFFKGYAALALNRVAHELWKEVEHAATGDKFKKKAQAWMLQSIVSEKFGVDIHPGAKFGNGVQLDHATGIVIGETAEVGHDVYILHGVTLGAKGSEEKGSQRHPKIGSHVVLGAGSKVIGAINVGDSATIAAAAYTDKTVNSSCLVVKFNEQKCRRK